MTKENDKIICTKCGHVFTEQQEGDCMFGIECPHCDLVYCEACSEGLEYEEGCPKCKRGF